MKAVVIDVSVLKNSLNVRTAFMTHHIPDVFLTYIIADVCTLPWQIGYFCCTWHACKIYIIMCMSQVYFELNLIFFSFFITNSLPHLFIAWFHRWFLLKRISNDQQLEKWFLWSSMSPDLIVFILGVCIQVTTNLPVRNCTFLHICSCCVWFQNVESKLCKLEPIIKSKKGRLFSLYSMSLAILLEFALKSLLKSIFWTTLRFLF